MFQEARNSPTEFRARPGTRWTGGPCRGEEHLDARRASLQVVVLPNFLEAMDGHQGLLLGIFGKVVGMTLDCTGLAVARFRPANFTHSIKCIWTG